MLTGQNGILTKAGNAKTSINDTEINERAQLAYTAALAEGKGKLTEQNLNAELAKEFGESGYVLSDDTQTNEWVISVEQVERLRVRKGIKLEENKLPTAPGTTPYFPSESFKQLEGTNLANGLVITDKSGDEEYGNEYVWIEVPNKLNDSLAEFGPEYPEGTTDTDYAIIENALQNYVGDFGYPEIYEIHKDEYYDGCGLSESEYNSYKNSVLKSIFENGGFWIGRYKVSSSTEVDLGSNIENIIPLTQQNSQPMCYISCAQAHEIAKRTPNLDNHHSGLLFGIQWDLILKYLYNKGVSEGDILYDHQGPWLVRNIYDLASINAEWTLECNTYFKTSSPCVARSAYGDMAGLHCNAFVRDKLAANGWYWISFRVAIY